MQKAFTLIELLVVVLIIGVLAAIAFPQFQTAIDKSRYATLMPLAKSVANAQESYYMAAGNYSPDLAYLDVQLPTSPLGSSAEIGDGTTVEISERNGYDYVKLSKNDLENNYVIYQDNSVNFPGEIHCEALKGSARAKRLCETLGGQAKGGTMTLGYDTYLLEGEGNGKLKYPAFTQNWAEAGIEQETIEKLVDAMTFLKEIMSSRERYYAQHGTYPSNFDQLDIEVPNNLRASSWAGTNSGNPDTYVVSCYLSGVYSSCIANAANRDLPMFQYDNVGTGNSCSLYGGKNNNAKNICEHMTVSVSQGGYYYIPDDVSEL